MGDNNSFSSSSFYLNQATWPISINKRHTHIQTDRVKEEENAIMCYSYNNLQHSVT